ncbi:MAG: chemotaxis protein methyltransferase CheR [Ramlibacter sp.]|jgi:signal transduction histidine kinase|nr:chemotaxis protein methyltransferase CheR [Ramlibacter sp.]
MHAFPDPRSAQPELYWRPAQPGNIDTPAEESSHAERRTNEMLATVAHELRNPLESLGSAIEILAADREGQAAVIALAVARRQLEQMSRLITQLVDADRLARGEMELELVPVRLQQVLADAVETTAPVFARLGHTLTVALPQKSIWVRGDAARCRQIFGNLLTNAAKYTRAGGQISLAAQEDGGLARVCVTDNGVGIAAKALPGLFEVFAQEQRNRALSQGGLGIGLAVVHRLVQLHGGSVIAQSEGEHKGSTFIVRLPLCDGGRWAGPPGTQ